MANYQIFKFRQHQIAFPFLLLAFVFSCQQKKEEKYPGFSETKSGLFYKVLAFGDTEKKAGKNDFLRLSLSFRTQNDSVFWEIPKSGTITRYYTAIPVSSYKGSYEEHLASLSEGDSLCYIVKAASVFKYIFKRPLPVFIKDDSIIRVHVKVNKVMNSKEYEAEQLVYKKMLEDMDIEEHRQLQLYVKNNFPDQASQTGGMYFIPLEEGTGKIPLSGCSVTIKYKGIFMNGRQFDSTLGHSPLEFVFGEQDQVIKGIEQAIGMMKEGGKAKIILPSQLAYGEDGSSTGIVPPYTSVIYELELVSVKDPLK